MLPWHDACIATPLLPPLTPRAPAVASASVLCWHCCHPFDTPALRLPIKYDERLDRFTVTGAFCSWACMKTYNSESKSHLLGVRSMLIYWMWRKAQRAAATASGEVSGEASGEVGSQDVRTIVPAPPRAALAAFGGWMSIEEFRGCQKMYCELPPVGLVQPPNIQECPSLRVARGRGKGPGQGHEDAMSYDATTTANEMVRQPRGASLKRNKPLVEHNMLIKTLGVQILS